MLRGQTDFGHFISWNPPDFVVRDLGSDSTRGEGKIYWTYPASGNVTPGSTALITLTVEDAVSGEMQAAAILEVEWDATGLNATVPG